MNRSVASLAALVATVLGCTVIACTSTSTVPATTSSPPLPVTSFRVCTTPTVTCAGEMKTEPTTIVLSADGSAYLRGLTWTGWGTATAKATGTLERNDCTPSCAGGTFSGHPATVQLTGLTRYGNGLQAYASMLVDAPGVANGSHDYRHLVP